MVQALGVRVPRSEAEATRRRLLELDALRIDLSVARAGEDVVFPVLDSCGPRLPTVPFDFEARAVRPTSYLDLLPPEVRDGAPRAFEALGDIVVVKVPPAEWAHRATLGRALLEFHAARAVFHDRGV
jgi:tRNA G37 N-methylase Trm5